MSYIEIYEMTGLKITQHFCVQLTKHMAQWSYRQRSTHIGTRERDGVCPKSEEKAKKKNSSKKKNQKEKKEKHDQNLQIPPTHMALNTLYTSENSIT